MRAFGGHSNSHAAAALLSGVGHPWLSGERALFFVPTQLPSAGLVRLPLNNQTSAPVPRQASQPFLDPSAQTMPPAAYITHPHHLSRDLKHHPLRAANISLLRLSSSLSSDSVSSASAVMPQH